MHLKIHLYIILRGINSFFTKEQSNGCHLVHNTEFPGGRFGQDVDPDPLTEADFPGRFTLHPRAGPQT